MRVVSLFDGISCARVAFERAKIPVEDYSASEICPYAIKIAQTNYPTTKQLGGVKDVSGLTMDFLIGGSPCQDLSIAKKGREGLGGDRSGLFWEFVRIKEESKPRWFLLENVASMSAAVKDTITKALGVQPYLINASLVSAQSRKRLFWTNIPGITQPRDLNIFIKDILEKEVDSKYTVSAEIEFHEPKKPKDLRLVGTIANQAPSQGNRVYSTEGKTPTLSAHGGGRGFKTGLYAIGRNVGRRVDETGTRKDADKDIPISRRIESRADGKSGTLTSIQKDNLVITPSFVRRLTPVECERLQGLPDNYTSGVSDSQRYKCLGNAFNVDVIAHILSFLPKT